MLGNNVSVLSALSVENARNKNDINRATLLMQSRKKNLLVRLPTYWHTDILTYLMLCRMFRFWLVRQWKFFLVSLLFFPSLVRSGF
jgi:hypothetical protein